MIDEKSAIRIFQRRADICIGLVNDLFQGVQTVLVIGLMSSIQFAKSRIDIVGYDVSIAGRVPDVWFYPSFMKMVSVPMTFSPNQIHSLGGIEYFHVGVVFFQPFHPSLFEADITDA